MFFGENVFFGENIIFGENMFFSKHIFVGENVRGQSVSVTGWFDDHNFAFRQRSWLKWHY